MARLGGNEVLNFYQEPIKQNYNFCYINTNKNYLINYVNHLFQGQKATMFSNNETWVIHQANKLCGQDKKPSQQNDVRTEVMQYLKSTFPKQKHLPLVFNILFKHDLIDTNFYFVPVPLHFADVCTFINNRFGKIDATDMSYIKLCKYLHSRKIKFPKIAIKNPVAQKYLC